VKKVNIMKNIKNKKLATTIALVLVLTLVAAFALPCVHASKEVRTYAFIGVSPNPVGIGQEVFITLWVQPIPYGSTDIFHNFEVSITRPDGTVETKGPMNSDPVATQFFVYIPQMSGNYTLEFTYPGETIRDVSFSSAKSPKTTLVVQEQQIIPLPENPLPTDYWARPISAENRNWWSISGNWLMGAYNATYMARESVHAYNPYSKAPRSSHIVWTKEWTVGGLVGGEYDSKSYYTGATYEDRLTPPIIINGRLYYRLNPSYFGKQGNYPGFICVDLRTGEELWRVTNGVIDVGQLYYFVSGNMWGVYAYLWDITGSTWEMRDAFSGELMLSFANASTAQRILFGEDGTMFAYILNGANNWILMWNSTKAFESCKLINILPGAGEAALGWRPAMGVYDWNKGIEWNKTVPDVPGTQSLSDHSTCNDVLVARTGGYSGEHLHVGYSAKTGAQLWVFNRTYEGDGIRPANGESTYVMFDTGTMRYIGYDITTGQELWKSDAHEYPWGAFTNIASTIAYGKLYTASYDGYIHSFDIKTGKQLWKFSSGNAGLATPYGTYPFWGGPIIADKVVFASTAEHSPTQPLVQGFKLFALDADTGSCLWNISGLWHLKAIVEGYLLTHNGYDNRIYCFGKGQTATTITGPENVQPLGTKVLIKGTVMDQSPGAEGTPAIADEYMSEWMEYLYMQKPCPMEVIGVPVKLEAFGSDDSYIELGTVTSNSYGDFVFEWAPPDEGLYTIMATFEGSDSYWRSYDATYLSVGPAAAPSGPIEPEPTEAPLITTEIAIIVAAVIVAVALIIGFWIIRKRK